MQRKSNATVKLAIESLEERCLLSAGFLDPTFAGDGMVTTNVGLADSSDQAWDVAVYPGATPGADGKIITVGNAATRINGGGWGYEHDFSLVRYNPNGSLDSTFGVGGKVTTSMGNGGDYAFSVELVGAKILAGGVSGTGGFALARYNDDGSLDNSFGSKGKDITKISGGGTGMAMKVDAASKIVMAGVDGNRDLAVVRYSSNGTLDKTFGRNGIAITPMAQDVSDQFGDMELAITPASAGPAHAGKILVVSRPRNGGPSFVARYTTAGVLDTTFDGDGLVTLPVEGMRPCVTVQADGRFVVAFNQDIFRLNTDGTLDTSFDGDGWVTLNQQVSFSAVTLQSDGKIIAAGRINLDPEIVQQGFVVARYTSAGVLDATFGKNGVGVSTDGDMEAFRVGLALQANGKVVVAGMVRTPWPAGGTVTDTAVARFEGDAALHAAGAAPNPTSQTLNVADLQPLVNEAYVRWQAAGVNPLALATIDLRIADLAGTTLGFASGHTITLDDNAAGWGWFVDPTPHDDSEFSTPGNQGEQHRMDLLTVLEHEVGHVLGYAHSEGGVMNDTLATGVRRMPAIATDWLAAVDAVFGESSRLKRRR